MLLPKKVKFRKQQRGRMCGKAWRGSDLSFGDFGLKVQECGYITDRQIEASRIAMTRFYQARGQGMAAHLPRQADHQEARRDTYGQGQGSSDHWVAVVRRARYCSRWRVLRLNWQGKPCVWLPTSCH